MRLAHRSTLATVATLVGLVVATPVASAKRWTELPLPPAMPAADKTGDVDVDGAKIHYGIYGDLAKGTTPVILLHGGLGNADHFAFQLPALIDKFQVIVIDSRGQGRSTLTKAKLTYHLMANDVLAVMDALEVKRASLVGWSDGGEMALDIAINNPDRVERMFVWGVNYDQKGSKPRGGKPSNTFDAYAAKCRRDYERMSKTPRAWNALVDALLPVWRNPAGFTRDQLKTIKALTMVADGDHDEVIVLDQVKEMAQLIPNGRLKVFAEASHFVMWQAPKEFNESLVEFLSAALP